MGDFSTFFEENHSLILAIAERRLGSLEDAEDATSETFRIAWQRHHAGLPVSLPWVYEVLRNLIGNEYRRRQKRANIQQKVIEEHAIREHAAADGDVPTDVWDAVVRLPAIYSHVVVLTYWLGRNANEVAEILGIESAAVRTRLTRARQMLATELGLPEEYVDEEVDADA